MTDAEMANEIAGKNQQEYFDTNTCCFVSSYLECYNSAIQMAEWKQRQQQQMLEQACNLYLKDLIQLNNLLAMLNPDYDKLIDVDKSYDDFKNKMRGEV